jgi:hypothetical protein
MCWSIVSLFIKHVLSKRNFLTPIEVDYEGIIAFGDSSYRQVIS